MQLRPEFGFDAAATVVPYLADLGVSHLYLSPALAAAPGSDHGYDVADPTRLSPELGGDAAFHRLADAAAAAGLGLLLDTVPNHMAADPSANPWWRDVLEDGPRSPHATWFDIDWEPEDAELRGRVLVPILDGGLGEAIGAGRLGLRRRGGDVEATHHATALPLSLPSLAPLLAEAATAAASEALDALGVDVAGLPGAGVGDGPGSLRRQAARGRLHRRLAAACAADPGAGRALDGVLLGAAADPVRLRGILDAQSWLLDDWRSQDRRINYRRFFTISTLAGFRAEEPGAMQASHRLCAGLVRDGVVDGLRIDHVDGLRDPAGYLDALGAATGGAWTVVEKILDAGETIPAGWTTAGTTGYEFAALLVAASVEPGGAARLRSLRDRLAGPRPDFGVTAAVAKRETLEGGLAADLGRLLRPLRRLAGVDPELAGATPEQLRAATVALLCGLPVYRTYVDPLTGAASPADRRAVGVALAAARREAAPGSAGELLERIAGLLLGEGWDPGGEAAAFAARFQQVAPAVMAKGVEDTAIYRDTAVLATAEVGCGPGRPLLQPGSVLDALAAGIDRPLGLLATSTHDTKRSEDVRARLCALTELSAEWEAVVAEWMGPRRRPAGAEGVDAETELMIYQTAAAAWPIGAERLAAYAVKAAREAGERTTWTAPDGAYEEALWRLVAGRLGDPGWVAELSDFVDSRLLVPGAVISLAWTLVRLTAPGVPDTYQGCELWERSLVDPDNRRRVDFGLRAELLGPARQAPAAALRDDIEAGGPGLAKLAVVSRALDLRRRRPDAFGSGGCFTRLDVEGPMAGHCLAFARGAEPTAVTLVPIRPVALAGGWGGTTVRLPAGEWVDLLGGPGDEAGAGTAAAGLHGPSHVDLERLLGGVGRRAGDGGLGVALLERVG